MTDQRTIERAILGKRIVAMSWLPVPGGGCDLEFITLEGGTKLNLSANHFGEVEAEVEENEYANFRERFFEIDLGSHGSLRIGVSPLSKPYCGRFIYTGPLCLNITTVWVFWLYASLIFTRETETAKSFMAAFMARWGNHANP